MIEGFTREEYIILLHKLKFNLELKLNGEYLPLQNKMIEAENAKDVKLYYELEAQIAPMRTEIAEEYDRLLLMKNKFHELYGD